MSKETNIIETALAKERIELDERELLFRRHKAKILPLANALHEIGADLSFPNSLDVRLIGDKQKFIALLRVLARFGLKAPKVEKGATGFSHFFYPEDMPGLQVYVCFSSTVCRRVKTGTKMVEQDVYETVCDEIFPHGEPPAPSVRAPLAEQRP